LAHYTECGIIGQAFIRAYAVNETEVYLSTFAKFSYARFIWRPQAQISTKTSVVLEPEFLVSPGA